MSIWGENKMLSRDEGGPKIIAQPLFVQVGLTDRAMSRAALHCDWVSVMQRLCVEAELPKDDH